MRRLGQLLHLATALWVAVLAGFFWAYAVSVVPGLALAAPGEAAAAMQSINIAVRNPAFAAGFFGAGLLCTLLLLAALRPEARAPWPALAGAALVLPGVIGVTAFGNLPLNRALAPLDPAAPETAVRWVGWLSDWALLNDVRMAFCLLGALLLLTGLGWRPSVLPAPVPPHGPAARG